MIKKFKEKIMKVIQPQENILPKQLGHVMVDIETMGHRSHSAIITIAAVEFDIETGQTGRVFNKNVNLESCLDCNLKMDADTVMWWMNQKESARVSVMQNPIHLMTALNQFGRFIYECGGQNIFIWGNSARFDLGILSDAHQLNHLVLPWDFRKEVCVRTLHSLFPKVKQQIEFKGVPHVAIDDCMYQIEYCSAIWNTIFKKLNNDTTVL